MMIRSFGSCFSRQAAYFSVTSSLLPCRGGIKIISLLISPDVTFSRTSQTWLRCLWFHCMYGNVRRSHVRKEEDTELEEGMDAVTSVGLSQELSFPAASRLLSFLSWLRFWLAATLSNAF